MDVVLYVCLWLDHYLHQHGGCGPTGVTWLGGVATYTTARDQCTEIVFYHSAIVARCFHLMLRISEYAFLRLMLSLECLDIMFR